jgi:CyaY protein
MNETEFEAQARATLEALEAALENCGEELDFELKAGGILELEFEDGSKIIVNRHGAAREIWVAARSGGFHYRWDGNAWRDTRDGSELLAALSQRISEQLGRSVHLRLG